MNIKTILLSLFLCLSMASMAQTEETAKNDKPQKVSKKLREQSQFKMMVDNSVTLSNIDRTLSTSSRYRLYLTDNIYNLLRLDTKTGKIAQVQWSLEDQEEECTFVINDEDFSSSSLTGSCSFELFPTKNMYQFILIDKADGRMWHLQWGTEQSSRWIRAITE